MPSVSDQSLIARLRKYSALAVAAAKDATTHGDHDNARSLKQEASDLMVAASLLEAAQEIDIMMATVLWEALEYIPSIGRDAEIAVMARVIAAARGIGRTEDEREAIPPAGRGDA